MGRQTVANFPGCHGDVGDMGFESDAMVVADSLDRPARFAVLYERHLPTVERYLARRVGSELAEDLAAEVFVRAFRGRGTFRAPPTALAAGPPPRTTRHLPSLPPFARRPLVELSDERSAFPRWLGDDPPRQLGELDRHVRRRARCDPVLVFARLSEPGRDVLVHAENEARALKHRYVGSESLLLGLLANKRSAAAHLVRGSGLTLEQARAQVAQRVGSGEDELTDIPLTPRAKSVLEAAELESRHLGEAAVGPEHILLGMAREDEGMAMRILRDVGLDTNKIREGIGRLREQ